MGDRLAADIYIVAASQNGVTKYWAARTRRDEAVAAVLQQLAPGWTATLTVMRITTEDAERLKLPSNGVRQLTFSKP